MKRAFTMIELVFVIVIIGILAAVAIPKLLATRDDAQSAVLSAQIKDGTAELISYYTSQGGEVNFSKIQETSQISFNELIQKGWAEVLDDNNAVIYSDKVNKVGCLSYKTDGKQIEVEGNTSNNSTLCKAIRRIIFGGNSDNEDRNYSILNGAVEW